MKQFRYDVVKDYKLYDIFTPAIIRINNLLYKTTYVGTENIPSDGAYLLAVNHRHTLDPFIAAVGLRPRGVHFISKKELFPNSFCMWFFSNMNAFPVDRDKTDYKAVKYAIKLLKAGKIVGIFPEGTRSTTGEFGQPKNGTVFLAVKTKCDILPAALVYDDESGKRRVKTTIRYGEMIKFKDLNLPDKPSKAQMNAATEYVMDKIKELYYMCQAE